MNDFSALPQQLSRLLRVRYRGGWPCALLCGLLLAAVPLSCSTETKGKGAPQGAVPVVMRAALGKDVPLEVRAIGTVEAFSTVSIRARVGGELTNVYFKEGQDVSRGSLLFTIDARPYEAALRQAEANLARDKVMANNAEANARRYVELVKQDYVTKEQSDQIISNAGSLAATVKADEAGLETARLNLEYCSIYAPIAGRTGSLLVHAGNLINANDSNAMVVLNQIQPIYVGFSVPEQYLPEIRKYEEKHTLRVSVSPPSTKEEPLIGSLTFIDNTVDEKTGTIMLKATFPNANKALWPGQFVNVALILTTVPGAVVVPSQAVQTGQQGEYVFVVKPDLTVESRPVVVGNRVGQELVIEKGLEAGERVVTDGQLRLVPGARVEEKNGAETAGEKKS